MGTCLSNTSPSKALRKQAQDDNEQSKSKSHLEISFSKIQKQILPTQKSKQIASLLIQKFQIVRSIQQKLQEIAYDSEKASDIAKRLLEGINDLQTQQDEQQTYKVDKYFNQHQNIEMIKCQKIFYNQVIQQIFPDQKKSGQKKCGFKRLSQNIKSRVYHRIANIKKTTKIDKEQYVNKFLIKCFEANEYKTLSQEQLKQVVKYEVVSQKIRTLGESIHFKFQSMQKQSQKMQQLLLQVIVKHKQFLSHLKYDFSKQEVMKVGQVSMEACNINDDGVFIILAYLYETCSKSQKTYSCPAQKIQKMMKETIELLSLKYNPGGCKELNSDLIEKLKSLELKLKQDDKFKYQTIPLTSQKDRQEQLQSIIMNYAKIAEDNKKLFQQLIKNTCLQKAVLIKIGLKLYPSDPNPKALTRIKQKMLIGKTAEVLAKNLKGSLSQIVQRQQTQYRQQVDDILEKKQSITFGVSDMVRGKCIFLQIVDIIDTINSIKKYVKQSKGKFKLQEIQSRFTNQMPISDVTLKILIDNKIVAELQLATQENAAIYNFAHKIYELQRTKVFSKIKIVDNYYRQFHKPFSQLTQKALKILNKKQAISQEDTEQIKKFFKIQSQNQASFQQILAQTIQINSLQAKKNQLKQLKNCIRPDLQDLMITCFCLANKLWYQPLGYLINKSLQKEFISDKNKSVILANFMEEFQLSRESEHMQQFVVQHCPQQNRAYQQIYMQEYLDHNFGIKNAYKYAQQNQKLYHRSTQLKEIMFHQVFDGEPVHYNTTRFVRNFIYQQNSFENIKQLIQQLRFYFVTKTQSMPQINQQFTKYFNWINKYIEQIQSLLVGQILVLRSQQLLEQKNDNQKSSLVEEASQKIEKAKKIYQKNEKQNQVMSCQIIQYQCWLRKQCKENKEIDENQIQVFKKKFIKNIQERAKIIGLQLKGLVYVDSMWRVAKNLIKSLKHNQRVYAQYFILIALDQMSCTKGNQFVFALMEVGKINNGSIIDKVQVKPNDNIKFVQIKLSLDCRYLVYPSWENLQKLSFDKNNIGSEGCKHLSRANFKNLNDLNLYQNDIGDKGCEHISKADWQNLHQLNLGENNIGAEGCKYLAEANWKNLNGLDVGNNIGENKIGDDGCRYLSRADWKNLNGLNLQNNKIGPLGCKYLSQANWKNLQGLTLWNNKIGDEGIRNLLAADWQNLSHLDLRENQIRDEGCKYLSQASWQNIYQLNLEDNQIEDEGRQYLCKVSWYESIKF